MKFTINGSAKGFENANYLLNTAIDELNRRPHVREAMKLSEYDVKLVENFRKAMVKGFLKK